MNFSNQYNDAQKEFASEVGPWLDANIPRNLVKPRNILKMSREQWKLRRELCRKLGERGWLYPSYPAQYGGGGLGGDKAAVLHIEMAARGLNLPPLYDSGKLAAPTVMACGTEEQKMRFLPPMLKGEKITWQLFTEPEAGTDEANQQTNALRSTQEKDYFIVNGGKIFVGALYSPPEQFLLLTRSSLDAPRHQNLAMFLAPADLPGVKIYPLNLFGRHDVAGLLSLLRQRPRRQAFGLLRRREDSRIVSDRRRPGRLESVDGHPDRGAR